MRFSVLTIATILLIFISSCEKEQRGSTSQTEAPVIDSMTTSKTQVKYGISEPAILKCYAKGNDLTYIWDVDFGDLFPINDEGSEVQFTASPCCMGEKKITCQVSNDGGKVTESITVTIVEQSPSDNP